MRRRAVKTLLSLLALSIAVTTLLVALSDSVTWSGFPGLLASVFFALTAVTILIFYRLTPDVFAALVNETVDGIFGFEAAPTGSDRLVGHTAVTTRRFTATSDGDTPRGQVRVRGETWTARWVHDPPPPEPRTPVLVEAAHGLVLDVGPVPD